MVKKILGSDTEIGAFVLGDTPHANGSSGQEPAWMLLDQFRGVRDRPESYSARGYGGYDWPQHSQDGEEYGNEHGYASNSYRDYSRLFLEASGGQAYYDSSHCEVATGECSSAFEYAAACRAMILLVRGAEKRANAGLRRGRRLVATANNTDGWVSWGCHTSVATSQQTQEGILRLPLKTLSLASFLSSSLILGGQGAVSEDRFVLLSRGPFLSSIAAPQTTFQRPIVNTRMESLAGPGIARHHVIFYDTTLNAFQTALKGGILQIGLALLEADAIREPDFLLEDPLGAIAAWNEDLSFRAPSRTAAGRDVTAVGMQRLFLDRTRQCARQGLFEDAIPGVDRILEMWESTLDLIDAQDYDALSRRLDWALKWKILSRAIELRPGLEISSPEIRALDTMYSAVGANGLFWAYEESGQVDSPVDAAEVERLTREPVETTRAWGRTRLLRHFPNETIRHADWDRITWGEGSGSVTFFFPDPAGCNRGEIEPVLERCSTLQELTRDPGVQKYLQRRSSIHEISQ
jgi:proteasome accessory factor A